MNNKAANSRGIERVQRMSGIRACRVGLMGVPILVGLTAAQAATVTWDGDAADGQWVTPINWSGDALPGANDTIIINNGDTVTWDSSTALGQFMPLNTTVNVSGGSTWAAAGVIRLQGADVTVGSGSTMTSTSGAFWSFSGSNNFTFENGAIVTVDEWEQSGVDNFTFNLGPAGFTALNPNNFVIQGGTTIADATYTANLAGYTGGIGVITLVDFNIDSAGMSDATFQGAGGLSIINGAGYTANLQWNDSLEAIELNITSAPVPEPTTLALLGLGFLALRTTRRRKR